jgi:glycosyltransferase involved in cell wall biosynthesis
MQKNISIIVPIYNEELSINSLYNEIKNVVLNTFNFHEIIFIDDGSNDSSFKIINQLALDDSQVISIKLNRNYGKSDALNEGFKLAKYEYIVTLDGDLQDDPNEIIKLINTLDEGWDCVSGWKKNRKDPYSKIIPSLFFNKFINFFSGLKLHDLNCGIKAYRKDVIQSLNIYGGLHRYIPLLLFNNGYKVTECVVNHRPREHGHTKYGKLRFFHGIFDFLTISFLKKYFNKPMYFFGFIGLLLSFIGLLINLYLSVLWFQGISIGNRPLFFLGILLIVVGIQSLSIGLIGELIINNNRNKGKKIKEIIHKK